MPRALRALSRSWWRLTRTTSPEQTRPVRMTSSIRVPHDGRDQESLIAPASCLLYLASRRRRRRSQSPRAVFDELVYIRHGSRRILGCRRRPPLCMPAWGSVDVHLSPQDGVAGLKELDERLRLNPGPRTTRASPISVVRGTSGRPREDIRASPMGTFPCPGARFEASSRTHMRSWATRPPRRRGKGRPTSVLGGGDACRSDGVRGPPGLDDREQSPRDVQRMMPTEVLRPLDDHPVIRRRSEKA